MCLLDQASLKPNGQSSQMRPKANCRSRILAKPHAPFRSETLPLSMLLSMMLRSRIVKTVGLVDLWRCARQTALERQDLSCTYPAHHELESEFVIIMMIMIMIKTIIIMSITSVITSILFTKKILSWGLSIVVPV